jgi:UDP-N-acetylglucosamine 2-epimerase (non-hydrolysing)
VKVLVVLGTRPEIIRLSCVIERLDRACELALVHTGQNFEPSLSDVFFEGLGVREPDRHLGVTGGSFADRVGRVLAATSELVDEHRPDRMLVLGDTDSAMSSYVAKRRGVPVVHMEAGNRCFDDRVPEEVNRRVIDHSSDILLPYTERSRANLLREGFHPARVLVTGNPIKEVLDRHDERIRASRALDEVGVRPREYLVLTLHRQETVDVPERLRSVLTGATSIASELGIPIVFSAHPRTQARIDDLDLDLDDEWLRRHPPFDFFDFVALEREALCVLTDSGTVQEECCIFGVPAVTVRDTTERPETIECGSNILSGTDPEAIERCVRVALARDRGSWQPPHEYLVPQVSPTVAAIVTGRIERPSLGVGEPSGTIAGAGGPSA